MMINLAEVEEYKIRLLKYSDIQIYTGSCYSGFGKTENTPSWVYSNFGEKQNNVYGYWARAPNANNSLIVWIVNSDGNLNTNNVDNNNNGVRPDPSNSRFIG